MFTAGWWDGASRRKLLCYVGFKTLDLYNDDVNPKNEGGESSSDMQEISIKVGSGSMKHGCMRLHTSVLRYLEWYSGPF